MAEEVVDVRPAEVADAAQLLALLAHVKVILSLLMKALRI